MSAARRRSCPSLSTQRVRDSLVKPSEYRRKKREYTDRKEAREALIDACRNFGRADAENRVGSFYGFGLTVFYDSFGLKYVLNIKGSCSNRIALGKDALGNMQRISNALAKIPEDLGETQQKLENVQR